ncbi:hypothetical protein LQZ19_05740 [Treponema primitia]|uniref:hypothetical protein n=1 Tax=Treponema primitia TaxID=88058 RepID=UPI003980BD86
MSNKKTNTLLFILAATVANILITIISFFVFYLLYALLIKPWLPENSTIWCLALIFLIALVVSFITYQKLVKLFMKKVDVQKYFDPIFKGPTSRG